MYSANGLMYTEEHSVSFGDIIQTSDGQGNVYYLFSGYNSWDTWHLIPSKNPIIKIAPAQIRSEKAPGRMGAIDTSEYFGRTNYDLRTGDMTFYADTHYLDLETLQQTLLSTLHGKKYKMCLKDDPAYYYEGYFTLGTIEQGDSYPTVTISYQLNPYKLRINPEGSNPVLWDPFNFETDYDYSVIMSDITVSGNTVTYDIYAEDYPFIPTATWVSGNVTVSFGGVSATLSSAGTASLGKASRGTNTLTVSGTGKIKIEWRGGSL